MKIVFFNDPKKRKNYPIHQPEDQFFKGAQFNQILETLTKKYIPCHSPHLILLFTPLLLA